MTYNQVIQETFSSSKIKFSAFCNLEKSSLPGHQFHFVSAYNDLLSIYSVVLLQNSIHKLIHLNSFKLDGIVTGLSVVSSNVGIIGDGDNFVEQNFEYLVLSFAQKISILSFSEYYDRLRIISLISFDENSEYRDIRQSCFLAQSARLCVDPESRMAAIPLPFNSIGVLSFFSVDRTLTSLQPKCFIVNLKTIDSELRNIVDFCFLEDYNIPALCVLVEPLFTDPCRLNLHKDTKSLYWLSLSNIDSENFILLGRQTKLPFDVFRVIPVKRPLGGVLLISSTAFIHMDSLGRACFLPVTTEFVEISNQAPTITKFMDLQLDLTSCSISQFSTLSHEFMANFIFTVNGCLYLLSFSINSNYSNAIHGEISLISTSFFPFSSLEMTATSIDQKLVIGFLGANEGPFHFLFELWKSNVCTDDAVKGHDNSTEMTELELELYAPTVSEESIPDRPVHSSMFFNLTSASRLPRLSIVDQLVNLNFSSESCTMDPHTSNLVFYSGFGRTLRLAHISHHFMQPCLRAEVLFKAPSLLPSCNSVFSSIINNETTFIFLSSESSTLVLKSYAGQLTEVLDDGASSSFYVEGSTLAVFTFSRNETVFQIQITKSAVFIFSSMGKALYRWDLNVFYSKNSTESTETHSNKDLYQPPQAPSISNSFSLISSACFDDPFLCLTLENGSFLIFLVGTDSVPLNLLQCERSLTVKCASICHIVAETEKRHILVVTDDRSVYFYHLPLLQVVWASSDLAIMAPLLASTTQSPTENPLAFVEVLEILILVGPFSSLALLVRYRLTTTEDSDSSITSIYYSRSSLDIHFVKLAHGSIFNTRFIRQAFIPLDYDTTGHPNQNPNPQPRLMILGGEEPLLLFFGEEGNNTHPMVLRLVFPESCIQDLCCVIKLPGTQLTTFGVTSSNTITISRLISVSDLANWDFLHPYDQVVPWQAKPLAPKPGLTIPPLFGDEKVRISMLRFDADSVTLLVVAESAVIFTIPPTEAEQALAKESGNFSVPGEPQVPIENMRSPAVITSALELISLQPSWLIIDRLQLMPYEQVLSLKRIRLNSQQTKTGLKWYYVLGTALMKGEDRALRGRILIVEVISVIPDLECPESRNRLKLVYEEEVKGPVSALDGVAGYLVAAIDGENLDGVAFMDLSIMVTSISVIKNYILLGDAYKSIIFAAFQEDPAKLLQLGKDFCDMRIRGVEMLPDGSGNLSLLVGEEGGSLHTFSYSPDAPYSMSGLRLLHRAEYFLSPDPIFWFERTVLIDTYQTRFISAWCRWRTAAGAAGIIRTVPSETFKQLQHLYNQMINKPEESPAGLQNREYRTIKCLDRRHSPPVRNSVDFGFVLNRIALSSVDAIDQLSRSAGWSGPLAMLIDLHRISRSS